jgi:hypothetical protein
MTAVLWPPAMSKATRLPSGSQHRTWPPVVPATNLPSRGRHHHDRLDTILAAIRASRTQRLLKA